jgi:hypothetical protein
MEEEMTATDNAHPSQGDPASHSVVAEIQARFRGPGGYYNIGNLIGLFTGVTLQLTTPATSGLAGTDAVVAHFVGSPATVALTTATIIFLISGEVYHRAWRAANAPDAHLNRLADLLSAAGTVALVISLIYLGQPVLAVFTGLLIVLGKLGSAVFGDDPDAVPFWPSSWPNLFRWMVLAGRVPGIAAASLELWNQLGTGNLGPSITQPAVMVLCHLLWIWADFLLFQGSRATARPQPA